MAHPLRSMTGFARARCPLGEGEVIVSVKSVNHRGLDIQLRAPESIDPFETALRAAVKAQLSRGHVDVRIAIVRGGNAEGGPVLNQALMGAYIEAFRQAAHKHGLDPTPDLNAAFRVPNMFGAEDNGDLPQGAEAALLEALSAALAELNEFRAREGSQIAAEMSRHNAHLFQMAAEMEQIRGGALEAFQTRLKGRLQELLGGAGIEPQRLAQEAAILADRSDISEELARLKIHSSQLDVMLAGGGEIGKKLDFLLQEMNRETNTILSKTSGVGDAGLRITELGLAAKAAIEKIREQSLNLE